MPATSCCWGNHGATSDRCGKSDHPPVPSDRRGDFCPLAEDADGYGIEACKCHDLPGFLFLYDVLQHVHDHDRYGASAPAAGFYGFRFIYCAAAFCCCGMYGGKGQPVQRGDAAGAVPQ